MTIAPEGGVSVSCYPQCIGQKSRGLKCPFFVLTSYKYDPLFSQIFLSAPTCRFNLSRARFNRAHSINSFFKARGSFTLVHFNFLAKFYIFFRYPRKTNKNFWLNSSYL